MTQSQRAWTLGREVVQDGFLDCPIMYIMSGSASAGRAGLASEATPTLRPKLLVVGSAHNISRIEHE